MANKVLGIEIGQNLTRIVEMDYKVKNPKIYNMFCFDTPKDMVASDGSIEIDPLFGSMLKGKLKENKVSTNKAIFVLNSSRIANREIELPNVKDSKIKDLLLANASDYFPVDLNQYQLIHEVLGRVGEGDEKKVKLSVIAVPIDIIRNYELLAQSCGVNILALDYTGNAIKQLMIKEIPGEVKVTIKVDENSSILTIMEDEAVVLQRFLNYGIGEAIDEIQDSQLFGEYTSFSDAVDLVRKKTLIKLRFDNYGEPAPKENEDDLDEDIYDSEDLSNLKTSVTENLRTLIGSFARVLDYYLSRNQDKSIDRIFLVGMGADFSGLSKLMSNELNHKVVPLQQFDGVVLHKSVVLTNAKVAEYFTCIGSVIKPLPIYVVDKKSRATSQGEDTVAEESFGAPIAIAILLVVAGIGITGFFFMKYAALRGENSDLQTQVNDLAYAESIVNEYQSEKNTYDWFKNIDNKTKTHNNKLKQFIEELEAKMPSQASIVAFTADETGVNMSFTLESVEGCADIIQNLRDFDSITVESISEIMKEDDLAGKSLIRFDVSVLYVDWVEDTEATEGTENAEAVDGAEAGTEAVNQ